jgi:hypothetical protein
MVLLLLAAAHSATWSTDSRLTPWAELATCPGSGAGTHNGSSSPQVSQHASEDSRARTLKRTVEAMSMSVPLGRRHGAKDHRPGRVVAVFGSSSYPSSTPWTQDEGHTTNMFAMFLFLDSLVLGLSSWLVSCTTTRLFTREGYRRQTSIKTQVRFGLRVQF